MGYYVKPFFFSSKIHSLRDRAGISLEQSIIRRIMAQRDLMMDPIDRTGANAWDTSSQRTNRAVRLLGGALVLAGLLLFTALLTYDAQEVGWEALRPAGTEAKAGCSNWAGVAGLYIAAVLYWLLGAAAPYGALLLQAPAWGMLLYPAEKCRSQWIACATMLITASLALAVQPWILGEWAQQFGLHTAGGWFGYLGGTCVLRRLMGIYWSLELFIVIHAVALIYLARLTPKSLYHAEKQELKDILNRWREKRRFSREKKEKEALAWRLSPEQVSPPESRAKERPPVCAPTPRPSGDAGRQASKSSAKCSAPCVVGENLLDLSEQAENDRERRFRNSQPASKTEKTEGEIELVINEDTERAVRKRFGGKERESNPVPRTSSKQGKKPEQRAAKPPVQEEYPLPPYELLNYEPVPDSLRHRAQEEMLETQSIIMDTLDSFHIAVQPGEITRGPSVTRYEFSVPRGQSVKTVAGKSKDIMAKTRSRSVNILAPIPGKSTVGVELENSVKEPVYLRELLQSDEFHNPKVRIPVALGKDVYGNPVIGDLAAMPHALVAGSTGSGKSVCINSMLVSFLYKFRPDELKLILVDPKVVEMQPYKKLPHLAVPVVTDPTRVIGALRWAVNEMEHRYKLFSRIGVRNLEDYNALPAEAKLNAAPPDEYAESSSSDVSDDIVRDVEDSQGHELPPEDEEELRQDEMDFTERGPMPIHLPYIVIVIDELADLMIQVKEDLENYIGRLTGKARAAGLHMIVATQSPRAQVVTGTIKTNLPSRIALKVSSQLDSRVILDEGGAENLLGKGDLLFLPPGGPSKMARAQGAFVSDAEIASIINFCASHAKQNFVQSATEAVNNPDSGGSAGAGGRNGAVSEEDEELYTRCVNLVITERKASTSLLQRRFSIGYGKAARIIDLMEKRGVISPAGGSSRPREVLIQQP